MEMEKKAFTSEMFQCLLCKGKQMVAIFKILMNTRTHTLAKILRLWLSMYYTQTYKGTLSILQKDNLKIISNTSDHKIPVEK